LPSSAAPWQTARAWPEPRTESIMQTRIHFQPASQIDNAGDQLINLATLNAVRRYGEIVVNDLRTPDWFIQGIGAGKDRRFSEFASRRFYVSLATMLLKQKFSGPALKQYLVFPPGHSARSGWREARIAFVWYAKLLLLRWLGCTVVRAGFSIGPFDRLNGWVESFGSRCFSYYGVRDRQSLALAQRFGFSEPHYFPDLAWSYLPPQRVAPAPAGGPVVLSFRSNAYGVVHSPEYLRPIRERLSQLLLGPALAGRRVVVAFQVQSDSEASQEIFEDLRDQGVDVTLLSAKLSIDEAASLYAGACCVISNRLHVLLLAAQSGTLPIPLADMKDNVKITSILDDNGLSDLIVNLEVGMVAAVELVGSILSARAQWLERLDAARRDNAGRIEAGFAVVFGDGGRRTDTTRAQTKKLP
jgi:hypothetical protein